MGKGNLMPRTLAQLRDRWATLICLSPLRPGPISSGKRMYIFIQCLEVKQMGVEEL